MKERGERNVMKKRLVLGIIVVCAGFGLAACSQKNENPSPTTSTSQVESSTSTEKTSTTTTATQTSSSSRSSTSSTASSSQDSTQDSISQRQYSDKEKKAMQQEFLDWAVSRAKTGGLAVSDRYFDHGAAGRGDWFAVTPDGEIQVQQNEENLPGFDAFDIHALGGVVFYTSAKGVKGLDKNAWEASTAEGYSNLADDSQTIHKYLLGDNGVVYELIGHVAKTSFSTGFGEYSDDGQSKDSTNGSVFKVSEDQDAQNKWQQIVANYN